MQTSDWFQGITGVRSDSDPLGDGDPLGDVYFDLCGESTESGESISLLPELSDLTFYHFNGIFECCSPDRKLFVQAENRPCSVRAHRVVRLESGGLLDV